MNTFQDFNNGYFITYEIVPYISKSGLKKLNSNFEIRMSWLFFKIIYSYYHKSLSVEINVSILNFNDYLYSSGKKKTSDDSLLTLPQIIVQKCNWQQSINNNFY